MSMNNHCNEDLIQLLFNTFHKPVFKLSDNATTLQHVATRLKYKSKYILIRIC